MLGGFEVKSKSRCSIDGCLGKYHAKGLCTQHYEKYRIRLPENNVKRARWAEDYRAKHSKEHREYDKKRYRENPHRLRKGNLKRKYGLTLSQYDDMFNKQNGCCAGCNKPQSEFKKMLSVDHRHSDGKIRGLLCERCNPVLGYVGESIPTLERLIQYLKDHNG